MQCLFDHGAVLVVAIAVLRLAMYTSCRRLVSEAFQRRSPMFQLKLTDKENRHEGGGGVFRTNLLEAAGPSKQKRGECEPGVLEGAFANCRRRPYRSTKLPQGDRRDYRRKGQPAALSINILIN